MERCIRGEEKPSLRGELNATLSTQWLTLIDRADYCKFTDAIEELGYDWAVKFDGNSMLWILIKTPRAMNTEDFTDTLRPVRVLKQDIRIY